MSPERVGRVASPRPLDGRRCSSTPAPLGEAVPPRWRDVASLPWALPLAVVSYALFRAVRLATTLVRGLRTRRRPERGLVWRALGPELLEERFATFEMATLGPRWNPHATIGVAGPFHLRGRLGDQGGGEEIGISVDLEALRRSADEWTLVVYRFPGYQTVGAVASGRERGGTRAYVDLAPGRYVLGLRYYGVDEDGVFPEVWTSSADRAERIPERPVPPDLDTLYHRLTERGGLLYRALAYHALQLLRYRRWLPRRLVERVLLPVGNPETRFVYGALAPGEILHVTPELVVGGDPEAVRGRDLYLTLYGPDSLPRQWCRVDADGPGGHRASPLADGGFFVLRAHPRRPCTTIRAAGSCCGDS